MLTERDTYSIIIHIPLGVCNPCAISLFEELRTLGYGNDDVVLFFDSIDWQIMNEAKIRSFQRIRTTGNSDVSNSTDIIIIRNNKYFPGYMKYSDGDQAILDLLLSY